MKDLISLTLKEPNYINSLNWFIKEHKNFLVEKYIPYTYAGYQVVAGTFEYENLQYLGITDNHFLICLKLNDREEKILQKTLMIKFIEKSYFVVKATEHVFPDAERVLKDCNYNNKNVIKEEKWRITGNAENSDFSVLVYKIFKLCNKCYNIFYLKVLFTFIEESLNSSHFFFRDSKKRKSPLRIEDENKNFIAVLMPVMINK